MAEKSIVVNPTWEAAIRIHLAAIQNTKDANVRRNSENEIIRCAQELDKLMKAWNER